MILNCIIPDRWTVKAVAASLGVDRENLGLRGRPVIKITPKHCNLPKGQWEPFQLKHNVFTQCTDPRLIWIHTIRTSRMYTQKQMEHPLKIKGIPYAKATVRVLADGKSRTWVYGVCVDIEDATRAILLLRPELLDERRAGIYNRDEPNL